MAVLCRECEVRGLGVSLLKSFDYVSRLDCSAARFLQAVERVKTFTLLAEELSLWTIKLKLSG